MNNEQWAAPRSRRNLGLASLSGMAVMLATPAFAQTDEAEVAPADEAVESGGNPGEAIVVTGSRIRRPNLESQVPVVSISGDEFFETRQHVGR